MLVLITQLSTSLIHVTQSHEHAPGQGCHSNPSNSFRRPRCSRSACNNTAKISGGNQGRDTCVGEAYKFGRRVVASFSTDGQRICHQHQVPCRRKMIRRQRRATRNCTVIRRPELGTPQLHIDQPPTSGTPQLQDDLPPMPGAPPLQDDPLPASGTPQLHNDQPPTPGAPPSQDDTSSASEDPQLHDDPSPWWQHTNWRPPEEMLQGESSGTAEIPPLHDDLSWQHANWHPLEETLQGESSVDPPQLHEDPRWQHLDWASPAASAETVYEGIVGDVVNNVGSPAVARMIRPWHSGARRLARSVFAGHRDFGDYGVAEPWSNNVGSHRCRSFKIIRHQHRELRRCTTIRHQHRELRSCTMMVGRV
jgi:hypothetical protein